jgi:DNA-binding NarL/FixJ family response regulator
MFYNAQFLCKIFSAKHIGGFFMYKSSRKASAGKYKNKLNQEYGELIDMIESGMEDYEIADELGIEQKYVSDIKSQIYDDMV